MSKDKSGKKSKNGKKDKSAKNAKNGKKAEREAKKAARKGDGSFPDILVVTKSGEQFTGFGEDMSGLVNDGETVAVYKLRRVSTLTVVRKVAR